MTKEEKVKYRSGFIALAGRPNAGKSTLMNTLVGEDLAVVSPMPQTTRRNLRGVLSGENWQIVFLDTPGIHKGRHSVNDGMLKKSRSAISGDEGTDIVCRIVDMVRPAGAEEDLVAEMLSSVSGRVCIVFNKADVCDDAVAAKEAFYTRYPGTREAPQITISAKDPAAKQTFLDLILPMLPEGPQFFSDDDITDADMRFLASELIRKHIIDATREEVPHAACVEILRYRETETRHEIDATIHVETSGQKAIIIGKGGTGIGAIRTGAQADIQKLAGVTVRLSLFVAVTPKWRDNNRFLREMGLDK